jgi:lipoprotein NlpD
VSGRFGGRRAIGVGLLVPGLMLCHPPLAAAEGKPARSTPGRAAHRAVASHPTGSGAAPSEGCSHAVRRGDSVGRIAVRYRVSQRSIIAANHLRDPSALRVGQRLRIAGCKGGRAREAHPDRQSASVTADGTELLARVGPRRVPTRLFVAFPDFADEGLGFRWPVAGAVVSGFGRRRGGWHAGVDIRAEEGAPIRAAAPGRVVFSGWEQFYGRMVKVQHPGGFLTLYAHNLENLVKVGDDVGPDAVIARVGRTGDASACHLHFEIRRQGVAYNPLYLLEGHPEPELASASGESLDDWEDRE